MYKSLGSLRVASYPFAFFGPNPLADPSQGSINPRRGRQIHVRAPYRPLTGHAGVDKSTSRHLPGTLQTPCGSTNQRPGTLQTLTGPAGVDKSKSRHLTDPSQAPQGSTNPLPGTLQNPHRHRRCQQIHVWASYRPLTGPAGVDKSTAGHLTDPSQAPLGSTNQRLGTLPTLHRPRRG